VCWFGKDSILRRRCQASAPASRAIAADHPEVGRNDRGGGCGQDRRQDLQADQKARPQVEIGVLTEDFNNSGQGISPTSTGDLSTCGIKWVNNGGITDR